MAAVASETQGMSATTVDGLGDEALWLWRPIDESYFALLLVRDGERFRVVMALLDGDAEDTLIFDYAMVVARRLE